MWPFRNQWKETQSWLALEQSVLETVAIACKSNTALSIRKQLQQLHTAYRYQMDEGFRSRYTYIFPCDKIDTIEHFTLSNLEAKDADLDVIISVQCDGGVVSEMYFYGDINSAELASESWNISVKELNEPADFASDSNGTLSDWIADLVERKIIRGLSPPVDACSRSQNIEAVGQLPSWYTELLEATDGAFVGSYLLLGSADLSMTETDMGGVVFLFDLREIGAIGVVPGNDALYLFDSSHTCISVLGSDYLCVIESVAGDEFLDV